MPSSSLSNWIRGGLLRNVGSNYLAFAVGSVITFALTPFLIHRLSTVEFGAWILLNTILGYFQMMELGVTAALVRFVPYHRARGEHAKVDETVSTAVGLSTLLASLALVLAWALSMVAADLFKLETLDPRTFGHALRVASVAIVLAFFKRLMFAVHEGHQRYDLRNLCSVSGVLLGAAATIYCVLRGGGLVTLVWILAVQTLYETALATLIVIRRFGVRLSIRAINRAALRRLFGFSYYAFLIDVAVLIAHRIDNLVIGIFLSVNGITFYSIATRLAGLLEKATDPLIDVFFPLASRFDADDDTDSLRVLLRQGTRISVLVIAPGLLMLAWHGPDVIRWWIGEEYVAGSRDVLYIFLGVIFAAVFEATSSRVLLGMGRVRFDANVSLVTAGLNLLLSLVLVRPYGLVGVALGTLVPTVGANFLVSVPYTCRITGTPVVRFYVDTLAPLLAVAAVFLPVAVLTSRYLPGVLPGFVVNGLAASTPAGLMLLTLWRRHRNDPE